MQKFLKGFSYGYKGIQYAFRTQVNFKVHTGIASLVIVAGVLAGLSGDEWLWIILAICMVLIAEMFNTALEVLVDIVSPNFNKKAGVVKDVAAGAVLLTATFAVVTGLVVFLPKIF